MSLDSCRSEVGFLPLLSYRVLTAESFIDPWCVCEEGEGAMEAPNTMILDPFILVGQQVDGSHCQTPV